MFLKLPPKLNIANIPTRIEKLERLSKELYPISIYIKRDDETGIEWSGNKIRKLEFAVMEAKENGCNYLITCGGNQSNHCRATIALAARLGLKCTLVLRGSEKSIIDGNLFLNKILGAEITFITPEDYAQHRDEIMKTIAQQKLAQGYKPYIIPEGASNGIGSFGYYNAMLEIMEQEKSLNLKFDAFALAVGSVGTYSGLLLAKQCNNLDVKLLGYLVGGNISYFKDALSQNFQEFSKYIGNDIKPNTNEIRFIDKYIGKGYGENTEEEIQFIKSIAQLEGIILDNVYTGKAFNGLISDIKKGIYNDYRNILFIHTGGIFELFAQKDRFI
jgi:D-cysteine desulfhydrase